MAIHRVFISSTYTDLLDYRQAVSEAVRGLDLHADDMDVWSADPRGAEVYSVDRVKQATVLILLLAHRYGTIPAGEQYSVTELEYRAAREAGIPVLAFFVDEVEPWPPQFIDWDARESLQRFKAVVAREVTRKYFRTPQELAFLVTQALAYLLSRSDEIQPERGPSRWLAQAAREVSTASRLLSEPDVLVPIGTAEDGLPLCLDVTRSRDLSAPFLQLGMAVSTRNRPAPRDMIEAFRTSLVDYATRSWADQDLHHVRLRTGDNRLLYVSPFTLSGPFSSIMSGFLHAPLRRVPRTEPPAGSLQTYTDLGRATDNEEALGDEEQRPVTWRDTNRLQSTGGRNRFLAIDPEDGAIYSVGRHSDQLVEWRPFLCESALPSLPNARLVLHRQYNEYLEYDGEPSDYRDVVCPVSAASEAIMDIVDQYMIGPRGGISLQTALDVSRHDLMLVVADVADKLATLHETGLVHGDVKPDNVLLTKDGAALIDSFEVPVGKRSPGWTPNWSAPEQVRGDQVTPAADVYSLAVMAAKVLGGQIVGEVRKYRLPHSVRAPREVDLFHDPSLYLDEDEPPISRQAFLAYRQLIESSWTFDPDKRPTATEFATELRELAESHNVAGRLLVRPTGALTAARFVDGRVAIARVITGHSRRRSLPEPPTTTASNESLFWS